MKKILTAMALLAAATGVHAEKTSGFTVGGALSLDASDYIEKLDDDFGGLDQDAPFGVGADVYAGFMFARASTVRVGYRAFGQQEAQFDYYSGDLEVDADGMYAALDLMMPLGDVFALGGTLGIQEWDAEVDFDGFKVDDDGRDFFYGLRAKWKVAEAGAVTASINRYKFDSGDELLRDIEYTAFAGGFEFFF
ncbi:outer membrane beta-barrel protein [Alcanivorax sp.]|jgi:hypothetical protein|uniref:outer membrane beta-barrel protein n=1 Tax=Alcanivorax sp. TaxID=1872427 RepID=UPI0032D8C085